MNVNNDKESGDDQVASKINVIDRALHGSSVPLLKDPIWERQNEINKSMFAKVNQIEQAQAALLSVQETSSKLMTEHYHKLRNALLENSAEGDATFERLNEEQQLISSRTNALSSELATKSTVLESNTQAVNNLQEVYRIVQSELKDIYAEKESLETRIASMEAMLKEGSEKLRVMFDHMEIMTQQIDELQNDADYESYDEGSSS